MTILFDQIFIIISQKVMEVTYISNAPIRAIVWYRWYITSNIRLFDNILTSDHFYTQKLWEMKKNSNNNKVLSMAAIGLAAN